MSDALHAKIVRFVEQLGEDADAVQIMVSWNEDGKTYCHRHGCGNWYARLGMAHDFIKTDSAQVSANEIGKVIMPEEEP